MGANCACNMQNLCTWQSCIFYPLCYTLFMYVLLNNKYLSQHLQGTRSNRTNKWIKYQIINLYYLQICCLIHKQAALLVATRVFGCCHSSTELWKLRILHFLKLESVSSLSCIYTLHFHWPIAKRWSRTQLSYKLFCDKRDFVKIILKSYITLHWHFKNILSC